MAKVIPKGARPAIDQATGVPQIQAMQALQKQLSTPSPTSEDPAARKAALDAMEEAADAERRAKGRASTILTGSGMLGEGNVSRRTLLGV